MNLIMNATKSGVPKEDLANWIYITSMQSFSSKSLETISLTITYINAICRTPAYRILDIETDVKVFIELHRPSDGATSEPRAFTYTPTRVPSRKRPRLTYGDSNLPSYYQQPPIISNVPAVQHSYQRPLEDFINPNVAENVEELNIEEIENTLNSLTPEVIAEYFETYGTDAPQEIIQKPVVLDDSRCTSRSLRNLDSGEKKIVTMFREEFLAFLKTNPPKRRVSMMLESLFEKSAKVSENMET